MVSERQVFSLLHLCSYTGVNSLSSYVFPSFLWCDASYWLLDVFSIRFVFWLRSGIRYSDFCSVLDHILWDGLEEELDLRGLSCIRDFLPAATKFFLVVGGSLPISGSLPIPLNTNLSSLSGEQYLMD